MNLFDLYAKVSLDTSGYERGVETSKKSAAELKSDVMKLANEYKKQGMSMSDAMKKAYSDIDKSGYETQEKAKEHSKKYSTYWKNAAFDLEKVGDRIKSAFKAVTVAGGALLGAFAKMGIDYNTQMETYTTNFEVMLGDTEAAVKKVNELKEMGAKTPFELSDLASATQTLLAFNVSADESNSVLQQLGDISLGNVEKLDSLTRAYGKMNASQKVTLEDINIMIDAGYNPLLNIQQKTGESMEELYDRISAGEVAFSEIQEAISAATSEGGQFYQGMEKASKTTEGLVSTLQDAVKSKAGEFFAGVSAKIKEALPNVISFIENIDVTEVTQTIKGMYDRFVELSPVIAGVTAAVVAFRTAMTIAVIVESVTKAITAFKTANDAATLSQALLNAAMNANPFVLIVTLIAGVVAAVVTLWNTNEDFRNKVIEIWGNILSTLSGVVNTIVSFFTQTLPSAFNTVLDFFKNNWQSILLFIANPFAGAFKLLYDNFEGFRNFVNSLFETVRTTASNIGQTVIDGINTAVSFITSLPGKAVQWGKDFIQGLIDGITSMIGAIGSAVSNVANTIASYIHFSRPDVGPLHEYEEWMPDMMMGLASGITKNRWRVLDAISGLSADMASNLNFSVTGKAATQAGASAARGGVTVIQNIYSQAKTAAELMREAQHEQERAVLLGV